MSREPDNEEQSLYAQAFQMVTGGYSIDHFTREDHEILGRRVGHVITELRKIAPQIRNLPGEWSAGGLNTTTMPFRGKNPPRQVVTYTPSIPTNWG